MQLVTKKNQLIDTQIFWGNKYITNIHSTRFFGLTTDTSLSWKYIKELKSKLNKACYTIRSIKPFLCLGVIGIIYFSYVHSVLSYSKTAGGTPAVSYLDTKIFYHHNLNIHSLYVNLLYRKGINFYPIWRYISIKTWHGLVSFQHHQSADARLSHICIFHLLSIGLTWKYLSFLLIYMTWGIRSHLQPCICPHFLLHFPECGYETIILKHLENIYVLLDMCGQ